MCNLDSSTEPDDLEPDEMCSRIFADLQANAISEVHIWFDGSSDEGQIAEITATRADGSSVGLDFSVSIPGKVTPAGIPKWDPAARTYVRETTDRPMSMREMLDEWAYEFLSEHRPGWEINDGSHGSIVISPVSQTIRVDFGWRRMETDDESFEVSSGR